jgi:hypothetical protein
LPLLEVVLTTYSEFHDTITERELYDESGRFINPDKEIKSLYRKDSIFLLPEGTYYYVRKDRWKRQEEKRWFRMDIRYRGGKLAKELTGVKRPSWVRTFFRE